MIAGVVAMRLVVTSRGPLLARAIRTTGWSLSSEMIDVAN